MPKVTISFIFILFLFVDSEIMLIFVPYYINV